MHVYDGGWIITNSGQQIALLDPKPEMIHIEDIAHALSNICRFGGHTFLHYSVAQHSWAVSQIVPEQDALCGLLHDATEAYIGDMVSPLKHAIPKFKEVEQRLWEVICEKFGLDNTMPASVKTADLIMLKTERDFYIPPSVPWPCLEGVSATKEVDITPWSHKEAYERFMERFCELTGGRK